MHFMTKKLEQADLISEIRDYICGTLVQRGIVDSTGVLELVEFLQDRYGISVKDEEITTDNLDTLNSITAYLQQKLAVS
jgi:acyl carrier protein